MPKPVCTDCKRFFQPLRNGVVVHERMPKDREAEPGVDDESSWENYKLWMADMLMCEGCGTIIVSGFGFEAYAVHFQPNFEAELERARAAGLLVEVNDC